MPISDDVKLGENVTIWHPETSNLYGCDIGDDCTIGALVEIQKGVVVGRNCVISSHSFLCEGVTLEDGVFVGHNVAFCNEKYPQAVRRTPWKLKPENRVHVGKGAIIGSNATILPGVSIGERAIVGAGSVVTKDVPPGVPVAGNPAGPIGGERKCCGANLDERIEEHLLRELERIVR